LPTSVPARKQALRVLHVGNVANNAYLNAKLQRRAGIEADALCDEWHIFAQPEWEEADLAGGFEPQEQLAPHAAAVGWARPEWVLGLRFWDPDFSQEPWLGERLRVLAELPRLALRRRQLHSLYASLRPVLGRDLRVLDLAHGSMWRRRLDRRVGSLEVLFGAYDVVQLYGLHAALLPLGLPQVRYVSFEHGTMRDYPFQDFWRGRLLALGYRLSDRVIITNPDVVEQARLLGLEERRYTFVPHPLDETRYCPGPSDLRAEVERDGFDFLLLCPSRHDWHVKGLDRLLRAFAEFVHSDRPKALLFLFDWGQEVDRSRCLVQELGVEGNVRWSAPLPKVRLIDAYRAADVVCDQFLIGTFGAVAPEAMACGTPVVMAFDPGLHAWCFPELPPVVDARTPEQISSALRRLAEDDGERVRMGQLGREWVERHHGWRLVVDRHLEIYEQALEGVRR
jgi:glycosyltransferase involved in cell wall biosynthesis